MCVVSLYSAVCAAHSPVLQTLMTVVQELDKTLFEGYGKPKADNVTNIIRVGILDSGMDWYDTPQPTGPSCLSECMRHI